MVRPAYYCLLLPICLTTLAGCTTSTKVGKEDPPIMVEKVTSVVLLSGEEIVFGEEGGKYQVLESVEGTSATGTPVAITTDNILEVRTKTGPPAPLDSTGKSRYSEVLLKDSSLVPFARPGGQYVPEKRSVYGYSKRFAEATNVPLEQVLEYRTERPTSLNVQYIRDDTSRRFIEVVLEHPSYRVIRFDHEGGRLGHPSEWIVGQTMTGRTHVPFDSILYATVERYDAAKTAIGVLGGVIVTAAVIAGIIVATKQSCPFLYSYDGARYQFDAEPLGGATTEGLARTDYSRLEYLKPVKGSYRLLMRNEVDETQFIDAISICIVDHDPSRIVVTAGENRFHLLPQPTPPASATDENGADLLPFVSRMDGVSWQTPLNHGAAATDNLRHTLTLRFLKPRSARHAQLVVRAGTTQWGSNVIRLMYNLLGTDLDHWYAEVDRKGPELYRLLQHLESEELYTLRMHVWKNGSWVQRGTITGGGPFVHETQTVPLAVSGIESDTLAIQVRPPLGFWSFDYAGIVFDDDSVCNATVLPLSSATDQDGQDISEQLGSADRRYFEMPTNRHNALLTFVAPAERPGLARTIFAKTTGYYKLHLSNTDPPQTAMIERLRSTPGEIVRYSLEKYRQWVGALRAQARPGVTP